MPILSLLIGCSSARPVPPPVVEEAGLHAVLRGIVPEDATPPRPGPATRGSRWSDVPRAAAAACGANEMAIVESVSESWGYRFRIQTVEDRPAELIVRRPGDDRVYEAEAWVGRYRDDTARAGRLLEAFDRFMIAFGRKRGFDD